MKRQFKFYGGLFKFKNRPHILGGGNGGCYGVDAWISRAMRENFAHKGAAKISVFRFGPFFAKIVFGIGSAKVFFRNMLTV